LPKLLSKISVFLRKSSGLIFVVPCGGRAVAIKWYKNGIIWLTLQLGGLLLAAGPT
jgi:hypothetical protein